MIFILMILITSVDKTHFTGVTINLNMRNCWEIFVNSPHGQYITSHKLYTINQVYISL